MQAPRPFRSWKTRLKMQDTRLGKFRKGYNVKLIAMMVGLGLAEFRPPFKKLRRHSDGNRRRLRPELPGDESESRGRLAAQRRDGVLILRPLDADISRASAVPTCTS